MYLYIYIYHIISFIFIYTQKLPMLGAAVRRCLRTKFGNFYTFVHSNSYSCIFLPQAIDWMIVQTIILNSCVDLSRMLASTFSRGILHTQDARLLFTCLKVLSTLSLLPFCLLLLTSLYSIFSSLKPEAFHLS